jgi:hydroxypyruvate isomerase
MLWQELPVFERFRAAAQAGFRRVEILFVHELDASAVERNLRELGLDLVLFDPRPGNWSSGERGLLCIPGREREFLETVHEGIEAAQRFGTRRLNALAGIPPSGVPHEEARQTAIANLGAAARLVQQAGITLLVEAINTVDMPGYFASTADAAAELVAAADSPNVRLQLDQYHVGMMGHDAQAVLRRYFPLVAHVQIADVPGRHQPGTGRQPITAFLSDLDELGYAGSVGLEYRPLGTTDESLAWLPRELRS